MTSPERPSNDPLRARMPADVDAPDKVLYGLTFRQLAVLAVAAVVVYGAWRVLAGLVPVPVLVAGSVVAGGLAFGLAVGRRDGLPLDRWLLAAIRHARSPRALSTIDTTAALPDWVAGSVDRVPLPAPLTLPADAIGEHGEISLGDGTAAMVAASSVNLALRTADEQAALVEAFGRWLNSLATPTQIVVSARPVDLNSHAQSLADTAVGLPHPALRSACAGHAQFLADLAERRDPLRRQILITTRTPPGGQGVRRRADDLARRLAGLGVTTRTLDGPAATAVLAAAADPHGPPRVAGPATPATVITAPPARRPKP